MTELLVLRVLHLVCGMFWVGSMLFLSVFLMPAFQQSGSASAVVMARLLRPRFLITLPVAALVTLLTGFTLAWRDGGNNLAVFARTPSGQVFTMSGGLAVVAFVIGFLVSRPSSEEMARLLARLSTLPDDEARTAVGARLAIVQRRSALAGQAVTVLVVLTAIGMAVARYIG